MILDVVSFAITGDTLRKLKTLKKIIRNGEDSCYATVVLENKATKEKMSVGRGLGKKQVQKVFIIYNGEQQSQLTDLHPRESDKFIEEKLGISFDDLTNYFIISKFKYSSLFLASDSDKKGVINRFSRADILDSIFPLLDKDHQKESDALTLKNNESIEVETRIKVLEEQIEALVNEDITAKVKKAVAAARVRKLM